MLFFRVIERVGALPKPDQKRMLISEYKRLLPKGVLLENTRVSLRSRGSRRKWIFLGDVVEFGIQKPGAIGLVYDRNLV